MCEKSNLTESKIIRTYTPLRKRIFLARKRLSDKIVNRFLAEIENVKKFNSAKRLIKYAGLDPVVKQSRKWISY